MAVVDRPSDAMGGTPVVGLQALADAQIGSSAVQAAVGSSASNAWYTLLGACVAATATLLAVGVKYWLDGRAEKQRHLRQLEVLRIDQASRWQASLIERRQKTYATALSATHGLYDEVRAIRAGRRGGQFDDDQYVVELRALPAAAVQAAVEEVRLISSDETAKAADGLWHHLRSEPVPRGSSLSSTEWVTWKDRYWELRIALVAQCKDDLLPEQTTDVSDPRGAPA